MRRVDLKMRRVARSRQAHGGKLVINKLCEDCGTKQAAFGFKKEKKVRWCFLQRARSRCLVLEFALQSA